ncbi:MAG TPA: hypothetical protein VFQ22_10200 [Longimicrobiales bacterium]|nr:hypothetical protein [Longimicrobiales bacterium]
MRLHGLARRLRGRAFAGPAGALLGLACVAALDAAPAAAQEGCVFGEEGNDLYVQRTLPGMGTVTWITRPHFVCEDGVQLWADSAVAYQADQMSHLIGSVRYVDATRELLADEARYFSDVARLQAQGHVRVTNLEDGSVIEHGDLVYLRVAEFRDEESLTVTTGSDGIRPRATLHRDSGGAAGDEPRAPYVVVGDRIFLRGSEYFTAVGDVVIEQDSLLAFADSAEQVQALELLTLVGSARVQGTSYELVGRTIEIGTADGDASEVRALRDAVLTGEDLLLTAPQIRLYLVDGTLERLVAVPLPEAEGTEPEEGDRTRPLAVAEDLELTGDSLELVAPGGEVESIFAAGSARSVSHARDSLNVESLPEIARSDWLEGDTIVVTLSRVPADSSAQNGTGEDESEFEVEQVVARVDARSLYRLLPEDTTARAGVDPPAVHYVVGDEITIHMRDGAVEEMVVVGQTRGVHLEPLSGASADSAAAPDSALAVPDSALAPPDSAAATPFGLAPGVPAGSTPPPDPWSPPAGRAAPALASRRPR